LLQARFRLYCAHLSKMATVIKSSVSLSFDLE
jgi:hypothetical protein